MASVYRVHLVFELCHQQHVILCDVAQRLGPNEGGDDLLVFRQAALVKSAIPKTVFCSKCHGV